jgi:hypothetical protein
VREMHAYVETTSKYLLDVCAGGGNPAGVGVGISVLNFSSFGPAVRFLLSALDLPACDLLR